MPYERRALGDWYGAHKRQQERALAGPMPPATIYKGERHTIDHRNDRARYRDMIARQKKDTEK